MGLKEYRVQKSNPVTHALDGKMMAVLFWEMDDNEMADFFNELGAIFTDAADAADVQMKAVAGNKKITTEGISAIDKLGLITELMRSWDEHA